MKKSLTLLVGCAFLTAAAQTKTTGLITFKGGVTANFTLNKATSTVTLILQGPADRWFGIGLGTQGMQKGKDALYYSDKFYDATFNGTTALTNDAKNDWTQKKNVVNGNIRELIYERNLVSAEPNDFNFSFDTTNDIDLGIAYPSSATTKVGHHSARVGVNAKFLATLGGLDDLSITSTTVAPNPASGQISIMSPVEITTVNLYAHSGSLVKSFDFNSGSKEISISLENFSCGTYLLEMKNNSEKTWKRIIIN